VKDFIKQTYTFMYENSDGKTVIHEVDGDKTWPELLDEFIDFLRGAGFSITEESLKEWGNE
jgi:hypothetical protein